MKPYFCSKHLVFVLNIFYKSNMDFDYNTCKILGIVNSANVETNAYYAKTLLH